LPAANSLSDLGSKQNCVVREYPGGQVTAQLFGSFPKKISWGGILFGSNAVDRSFDLQQLCDNGEQVTLEYSQWSFDGFVEDYSVTAASVNEVHYKMSFIPVQNNSTVSGGNLATTNDPFASIVGNAQDALTQQSTSPSSGAILPAPVQTAATTLNQSVNQALQGTGGSVSAIDSATVSDLQDQISNLMDLLTPLIGGSDSGMASAAGDLNGTLGTLQTAFGATQTQLLDTVTVQNPNLYQLSAQYYGSPWLYRYIQDWPDNNLTDPLPVTDSPIQVQIPVLPPQTTSGPATVVSLAA
jgi:hypothetical protein